MSQGVESSAAQALKRWYSKKNIVTDLAALRRESREKEREKRGADRGTGKD